MKIGILGAGNIGGTLGQIWASKGHEICFAVRDPDSEKAQTLLHSTEGKVQVGKIREATQFGEVILLAVHWKDVPQVLEEIKDIVSGKIVIDSTNRMIPSPPETTGSAAGDIAKVLKSAEIVKGFSTLGANNLKSLTFGQEQASTFICGNSPEAKAVVRQLGEDLGFDVIDVGALETAPLLESLTKLWVQISRSYGREIAFKLLRH